MKKLTMRIKKLSKGSKIALAYIALLAVIGFYAMFIEPFTLKVTTWQVQTDKWPYDKPLKIAILTDMHMKWPSMTPAHLQRIVDKTNSLNPDIVVLLGDYVATHPFGLPVPPEEGVIPLKQLKSKCGVFAIGGNHDFNPPSRWPEVLRKADIPYFENENKEVDCHNNKFWIAGLEELWWQNVDVGKALEGIPDDDPVIMLMHNPDSFVDVPERVTLSMAGHTHAGQIRFPFIGAIESVIPSKYGKRFLYGHIKEGNKDLIVSSGLGMTGIPLRFMTPPEIGIVELSQ